MGVIGRNQWYFIFIGKLNKRRLNARLFCLAVALNLDIQPAGKHFAQSAKARFGAVNLPRQQTRVERPAGTT